MFDHELHSHYPFLIKLVIIENTGKMEARAGLFASTPLQKPTD